MYPISSNTKLGVTIKANYRCLNNITVSENRRVTNKGDHEIPTEGKPTVCYRLPRGFAINLPLFSPRSKLLV